LSRRGFTVPRVPAAAAPSWCRYPVLVPDRAAADRATRDAVALGTWFSSIVQEGASWEAGGYTPGTCPTAERAVPHLANIPTHPRVRDDDVERIAAALPAPPRW
jgi:dTDP-4-amino-4,6-dideoxygalactose transaminase